jgi:hypothetical protein
MFHKEDFFVPVGAQSNPVGKGGQSNIERDELSLTGGSGKARRLLQDFCTNVPELMKKTLLWLQSTPLWMPHMAIRTLFHLVQEIYAQKTSQFEHIFY